MDSAIADLESIPPGPDDTDPEEVEPNEKPEEEPVPEGKAAGA